MSDQASCTLRGRNPDVRSCIAITNLTATLAAKRHADREHPIAKSFDIEDGDPVVAKE